MRYLVDTHGFIFWVSNQLQRLRPSTTELIASTDNEIFVSAISAYEISLKRKLGKLSFPPDIASCIASGGFLELPLTSKQAQVAGNLELVHRDLFDRLLAAQAIEQRMSLITLDGAIASLGAPVVAA